MKQITMTGNAKTITTAVFTIIINIILIFDLFGAIPPESLPKLLVSINAIAGSLTFIFLRLSILKVQKDLREPLTGTGKFTTR